jgi:hypothetical protein
LKLLGSVNFDRSTRIPDLLGSSLLTIAVAANGWSICGAQRAQPVATGGKLDTLENGSNRPIGNRWQPTATVSQRMVRRGSTVRVRQRASQKASKWPFSLAGKRAAFAA